MKIAQITIWQKDRPKTPRVFSRRDFTATEDSCDLHYECQDRWLYIKLIYENRWDSIHIPIDNILSVDVVWIPEDVDWTGGNL